MFIVFFSERVIHHYIKKENVQYGLKYKVLEGKRQTNNGPDHQDPNTHASSSTTNKAKQSKGEGWHARLNSI
jgi:hypothetical protein